MNFVKALRYRHLAVFGFGLALANGVGAVRAGVLPEPIADYTFDGTGADATGNSPPMDLLNTSFANNTLYLNGLYELGGSGGYRAIATLNGFSYSAFTVAVDFKPLGLSGSQNNVLTGGTSYRWLSFRSNGGFLELTLNNQNYSHLFANAPLTLNQWQQVVCALDVAARTIVTFLNGVRLEDVILPTGFQFDVVGSPSENLDKKFTFSNYSNGSVFYGYADNLVIYGRALSPDEIAGLVHRPPIIVSQPQSRQVSAGTPVTFSVVAVGTGPLAYQWSFNSLGVAGATGATLDVGSARFSQAGDYQVVVSNTYGAATSAVAALTVNRPRHTGRIVLATDDWILSDAGFANAADTAQFALNIADWFTHGAPGRFLASSAFSLGGQQVGSVLTAAGNTWVINDAIASLSTSNLLAYDALFLGDTPLENQRLIDYVKAGGSVYLYGLGYGDDGSKWNDFLDPFGLAYQGQLEGCTTFAITNDTHPIFNGVTSLFVCNGASVGDIRPGDPGAQVLTSDSFGEGLVGVWDPEVGATLVWTNPLPITYGTPLGSNQLNASANLPGTFAYQPAPGTVLDAGTNVVSVVFRPADTNNFDSVTGSVSVVVLPAPLTLTANDASRPYGEPNPEFTGSLDGLQNGDLISGTFTSSAGQYSFPGFYPIIPVLHDPHQRLGNYAVTLVPGSLTVLSPEPGRVLTFNDFSDATSFWLNGDAAAAVTEDGHVLELTRPTYDQVGSGFLTIPISLANQASFNTSFSFRLSHGGGLTDIDDVPGADGITFLAAATPNVLGLPGGGLGYLGISNSFAVEYDTWFNSELNDADGNHVAVNFNGNLTDVASAPVETPLNNGEVWYSWIDYDGQSARLEIRLSQTPGRPVSALIAMNVNLETILGRSTVFLGFSGGTGGGFNQQDILSWRLAAEYEAVGPPVILAQPADQTLPVGATASFTVSGIGAAPLNYQWQFNGVDVPGATGATFTVPNLVVGNAGRYRVVLTNPYGSASSSPATLAVFTAPTLIRAPVSAQVTVGGTAVFTVIASSSGPLNFQWLFEGNPIPGATGPNFTVTNAQFADAGSYNVEVFNVAGSVTSPAAALLVVSPSEPPVPQSSYAMELLPGLNLIANQLDRGGNTLSEIMPLVPDGSVVSKFDNVGGNWLQSTFQAAIGAWVPANIRLAPGEGAFFQSPASFTLTFSGTPHVPVLPVTIPSGRAYLLSRQTNDVGNYENIVGTPAMPGAVVYKWNHSNATYTVLVYNSDGWVNGIEPSAAIGEAMWFGPAGGAPVPIPLRPTLTQQPVAVTTTLGSTAIFTAAATGTEPLSYQWRVNGNSIAGATSPVLTVANVQAGSSGNYSVVVNNMIGTAASSNAWLTIADLGRLPVADNFANAGDLGTAANGAGLGSTAGATIETGEPQPDGIPGGASVWLRWQPQTSGRATFTTAGSGFDTVFAVYVGTSISNLVAIAADDDSAPFLCSKASFNAVAGTTYFLQFDGFYGAAGHLALAWNLGPPSDAPLIVTQPKTQTVPLGSNVTMSVEIQSGPVVAYQWFFNSTMLSGATDAAMTLPNFSQEQVGIYSVAVTNTETLAGTVSQPASIQLIVADSGQRGNPADVHAQDKFVSASDLTPPDPNIHDPAPAGSFTGNQTFSTVGATSDPGEPNHCGYPACGSYWCSYQAPASGLLTIDTKGTVFNAVLAVYSGPGTDFATLVPVACSANHGAVTGESVTFAATSGTTYWVVIEGINCATGTASINYTLTATPAFTLLPVSQTVSNGARVTLTALAVGAPTLGYQWRLNGTNIPGATASSLILIGFQTAKEGAYSVVATNLYGTNISAIASIYINNPSRFISAARISQNYSMQLVGLVNTNYVLEASSNLLNWVPVKTNSSPIGLINFSDPFHSAGSRYYRARKQ